MLLGVLVVRPDALAPLAAPVVARLRDAGLSVHEAAVPDNEVGAVGAFERAGGGPVAVALLGQARAIAILDIDGGR